MESFLKNRPVHSPATSDDAAAVKEGAPGSPFTPIQRGEPATSGVTRPTVSGIPERAELDAGCSPDGAKVRAIMERGRVTRIIVTCSCGKVTEVACNY